MKLILNILILGSMISSTYASECFVQYINNQGENFKIPVSEAMLASDARLQYICDGGFEDPSYDTTKLTAYNAQPIVEEQTIPLADGAEGIVLNIKVNNNNEGCCGCSDKGSLSQKIDNIVPEKAEMKVLLNIDELFDNIPQGNTPSVRQSVKGMW